LAGSIRKIIENNTEAVFLVMLGTNSIPARHEVYGKQLKSSRLAGNELVPGMTKNTASGSFTE